MALRETPSQTAGPYVHLGLVPEAAGFAPFPRPLGSVIAEPAVPGPRIRVEGALFDAAGAPVRDAVIEVWQADAEGRYPLPGDPPPTPGFTGWARVVPDRDTGAFGFDTIRPGGVRGPDGRPMAPHIAVWIVARGINLGLATRMYFADADNSADPVLAAIDPPCRRATLIAPREDRACIPVYRFDIRLAGPDETVFFDF